MHLSAIEETAAVIMAILAEQQPDLQQHLFNHTVKLDLFLLDWTLTLFAKSLPLELAARVWDMYFIDGESVFYRTVLALFDLLGPMLLTLQFDEVVKCLSRLSEHVDGNELLFRLERIVIPQHRLEQLHAALEPTGHFT